MKETWVPHGCLFPAGDLTDNLGELFGATFDKRNSSRCLEISSPYRDSIFLVVSAKFSLHGVNDLFVSSGCSYSISKEFLFNCKTCHDCSLDFIPLFACLLLELCVLFEGRVDFDS